MSAVATRTGCAATHGAPVQLYHRRRPERTVLYRLVQQHLETWLARAQQLALNDVPVPLHVERELRRFLECGILACGFARAYCDTCGHDFLIAFSCKGRGICPSCTTRRMAETAAHLVEQVFPQVPVRQWVITFPKRLRFFVHRNPQLLSRVRRIALRAIDGADQPVRYVLSKPLPSRATELTLTPLELLDRLAALIPPPR